MAESIRIKNIFHMLSYAYQDLREAGFSSVGAEEFENIHDLFAAILVRGVGNQIRRGLFRDYIPHEESLSCPRGRILLSESVKGQTIPRRRLICSFDEFTVNSPHNRVLKSTMLLLLRHGNVRAENRKRLRRLLQFFHVVDEISPRAIRWDGLKYHRNNAGYRMLINICRLVVTGLLQTTDSGAFRLAKWLDEEKMHRLYEKFVLSYYRTEHPEFSPQAAYIAWDVPDGADRTFLPAMKTDITLQCGDRTLIIDTKWYSRTIQTHPLFGSASFISHNLYQIFTYVKNRDAGSTGNVAGMLLYAKTDEAVTPDGDFTIGGNLISLKTLDLGQEWSGITKTLESLCSWLTLERAG